MRIDSRRFGSVSVVPEEAIVLAHGMLGFPDHPRYAFVDATSWSPFRLLLSLDDPELGFAVANPGELIPGYEAPLVDAARLLGADPADVAVFAVVNVAVNGRVTANLMAPLVVDTRTRQARQVVLDDARFAAAHPLVEVARR